MRDVTRSKVPTQKGTSVRTSPTSRAAAGSRGAIFDNTPDNLAVWLRDPPGVKPGVKMPDLGLSEDQIEALVAYLRTLR